MRDATDTTPTAAHELWEGPRERLRRLGPAVLSDAELIAALFRTGARDRPALALAEDLLRRFGGLRGLWRAGDAELRKLAGVGPVKIASLRAAFELGRRHSEVPLRPGERFTGPDQVAASLGPRLRHLRQEVFCVLLLDTRQRLIRELEVSRGSLNQSLVHPREVYAPALREAAAGILVLHNHPSGDPEPSREDHEVTRRLERAGAILGVPLLDHVIVADQRYCSFCERGWLVPGVPRKA